MNINGLEGTGLKQKLRDLERKIETEVKSARAELTVLKSDPAGDETGVNAATMAVLEQMKKDITAEFEESKAELSQFFNVQKNENQRYSSQIRQLKDDVCGLQQSMVALQRRLRDVEEEVGH